MTITKRYFGKKVSDLPCLKIRFQIEKVCLSIEVMIMLID